MICSKCGANVNNGSLFCTSCGAKMDAPAPAPVPAPMPAPQPNYNAGYQQAPVQPNYNNYQPQPVYTQPVADTTPISPIGYVGYMLLFSLQPIGLIMMFVYAFGSNTNVNLKNFARAYLILQLIAVALVIISWIVIAIMGVSILNLAGSSGSY